MNRMRRREAERVHDNFSLALSYLGYEAAYEAFGLFASVNLTALEQTTGRYLDAMKSLTLAQRDIARRLAIAYYRLMRALFTGQTFTAPGERSEATTLGDLRQEFMDTAREALPDQRLRPTRQTRGLFRRAGLGADIQDLDTDENDLVVESEDFDWPSDLTEDGAESTTETRLKGILDELAKRRKDREDKAKAAYEAAAVKQAGIIQQNTMNAGRSTVHLAIQNDSSAIGYVRASKTGDPCYFCAMLISRGIYYKTERGALRRSSDGEKYHDNCNCTAYPVYSRSQYDTDPRFALNKELDALWREHIRGRFSGNEARNEWRKVIREWKTSRRIAAA